MSTSQTRAIVFANGDLGQKAIKQAAITPNDFICCVDGGLQHAQALGLQPQLILGDFDSATPEDLGSAANANVERVSHPPKKDASDLELALLALQDRGMQEVVLLGASGGRTDHALFNWMLPALQPRTYRFRIIDETVDAYVVNRTHRFEVSDMPIGSLVSLLPLREVKGVTTQGLEYALVSATIKPGSTIGLSNVVVASRVSVEIASGVLLVLNNY